MDENSQEKQSQKNHIFWLTLHQINMKYIENSVKKSAINSRLAVFSNPYLIKDLSFSYLIKFLLINITYMYKYTYKTSWC